MGFIFQSYNLLPVYSVYENVELPLILNNIDKNLEGKKVLEAIDAVGLSDKINSGQINLVEDNARELQLPELSYINLP